MKGSQVLVIKIIKDEVEVTAGIFKATQDLRALTSWLCTISGLCCLNLSEEAPQHSQPWYRWVQVWFCLSVCLSRRCRLSTLAASIMLWEHRMKSYGSGWSLFRFQRRLQTDWSPDRNCCRAEPTPTPTQCP